MASIVELRDMSDERIEDLLEDAREEMFNLRFQHASARLEDSSRIRSVRRDIAQFESVLRMRQMAVQKAVQRPEVIAALGDAEWTAKARFSYEDTVYIVSFADAKGKDLTEARVDLNKKKIRGRKARRAAR